MLAWAGVDDERWRRLLVALGGIALLATYCGPMSVARWPYGSGLEAQP